ncbi:MAG: hypothetical protein Q9203_004994 [Teloschistes exilis]
MSGVRMLEPTNGVNDDDGHTAYHDIVILACVNVLRTTLWILASDRPPHRVNPAPLRWLMLSRRVELSPTITFTD